MVGPQVSQSMTHGPVVDDRAGSSASASRCDTTVTPVATVLGEDPLGAVVGELAARGRSRSRLQSAIEPRSGRSARRARATWPRSGAWPPDAGGRPGRSGRARGRGSRARSWRDRPRRSSGLDRWPRDRAGVAVDASRWHEDRDRLRRRPSAGQVAERSAVARVRVPAVGVASSASSAAQLDVEGPAVVGPGDHVGVGQLLDGVGAGRWCRPATCGSAGRRPPGTAAGPTANRDRTRRATAAARSTRVGPGAASAATGLDGAGTA